MKTYGGFLISQIGRISSRTLERLIKKYGIDAFNGAQGRILYVLWANEKHEKHEKLTITDIARFTSMANTTLTSVLDRMEAEGLVRREHDKVNRRQIFVSTTEKANEYRKKYDQLSDDMNAIFYKGFSETEIMDFENQLRRILKNMEEN